MSEQAEQEQPQAQVSACPHPEAAGTRWGDDISAERMAELKVLADQQREWASQSEADCGESHFKDVRLTGADVFRLADVRWQDVEDALSGRPWTDWQRRTGLAFRPFTNDWVRGRHRAA